MKKARRKTSGGQRAKKKPRKKPPPNPFKPGVKVRSLVDPDGRDTGTILKVQDDWALIERDGEKDRIERGLQCLEIVE